MNQTVNVNLAGIAFALEEEGYHALERYLDTLRRCYGTGDEGEEIVSDIEARIAELLLSYQPQQVIPYARIESVLDQLGLPEEVAPTPPPVPEERIPRRLYRDPERRKIGGVCSGLGAYMDLDPAIFRVGIFLPLILLIIFSSIHLLSPLQSLMGTLFGAAVLTYFILWIAIPLARNPRHRLEMRGRSVTPDSIREQVMEQAARDGNSPQQRRSARLAGDFAYTLGTIALILIKIVAAGLLFGLACAILGLVVGAVAVVVDSGEHIVWGAHHLSDLPALSGVGWRGLFLAIIIGAALPLIAVVMLILRSVFGVGKGSSGRTQAIVWGLWAIVLLFIAGIAIKNASTLMEINDSNRIEWSSED